MKSDAITVGAGIGGVASAIRLAAKGYMVIVFERNSCTGGKLSELRIGEYRFDKGPSLFTLPFMVDELFILCGKNPTEHFEYQKLENICRYFYEDELVINAWQDIKRFGDEVESKTGVSRVTLKKFLEKSKLLYNLTSKMFLFRSFRLMDTFFSKPFFKALMNWWKLDAFTTMHHVNDRLFDDKRIVQLFERYATYNGSNPYLAPGTLNVISHLEHNIGAYFPKQGMYSIIHSLTNLAIELGVDFKFDTPVEKIYIENHRGKEVRAAGEIHTTGLVVIDCDIVYTYKMLDDYPLPKRYYSDERSTSALNFLLGHQSTIP